MKTQTYYITETEKAANICDLSENVLVNCAGSVKSVYGIKNSLVRNDFYLMYVTKGKMEIEINGKKSDFSEGQFVIVKAGTPYAYKSNRGEEVCYLWIHFTGKETENILDSYYITINKIENVGINVYLFSLWKRIFREFIINDTYSKIVSANLLNEILAEFSRSINRVAGANRILKSIEFIHENYSRELRIKDLAEIEDLSQSYYRVCFKEITGVSPSQYLMDRRMDAAMQLLENSDMSLNEISELVGYTDQYYFGRIFKKKFGISPGKYRKQTYMRSI